ncbi:MAG: ring-cleaving dioxygenase [Opitutales bacterium]
MIQGLHHVTAIARDPQTNLSFYRDVLGMRFIKKTVNFDDPSVYHFYFADANASPGCVLTFFPWPNAVKGVLGAGQVATLAFAVRTDSLDFWKARLADHGIEATAIADRFGQPGLGFDDPEGLPLELLGTNENTGLTGRATDAIIQEQAIQCLAPPTLLTQHRAPTVRFLEETVGAKVSAEQGQRTRLSFDVSGPRNSIDVVEDPQASVGRQGYGSVHHVAFAIEDDATQQTLRAHIAGAGHTVTPMRDRQYFHSIYFPEPSGVLCEVATNGPGFAIDEAPEALGTKLMLPAFLENRRDEIEAILPPVQ